MTAPRWIIVNAADEATLTASPAVAATLPVTNLQLQSRAKAMRTTSTADQQILGTWTSAQVLSAVVLWRHNLTSAATWRLELFDAASQAGNTVYDSGAVVAAPPKALGDLEWGVDPLGASVFTGWELAYSDLWFTPVVALSFRLTISDATNPAGYFQASRLLLGRYLETETGQSFGYRLTWEEATTLERTDGGTLRSDGADPYRVLELSLEWLTEGERAKFAEMFRRVGRRRDFFVSLFPGSDGARERDYALVGKLTASQGLTHGLPELHQAPFKIEEA